MTYHQFSGAHLATQTPCASFRERWPTSAARGAPKDQTQFSPLQRVEPPIRLVQEKQLRNTKPGWADTRRVLVSGVTLPLNANQWGRFRPT